jgi:molybdopterin-biosynthesis enzyme MoeA-like protein
MVVADAGLGETADFTADSVAAAMQRLLEQNANGRSDALRQERARWARDNVSLAAVGRRAADAVQSALTGAPRAAR